MSRFFSTHFLKRLVPLGLAASAAIVLLAPAAANAAPYVVKLTQQGNNVVATGSGAFDLVGWTLTGQTVSVPPGLAPDTYAYVFTGPGSSVSIDAYADAGMFVGPTSFGSGIYTPATSGSGDVIEFLGAYTSALGGPNIWLPSGYVSGTELSSSATWDNATFASLGVTPGTFVWTWGNGAEQSFTLDIIGANVPEPAALGMFGFGMLMVGAFVSLRRRTAGRSGSESLTSLQQP